MNPNRLDRRRLSQKRDTGPFELEVPLGLGLAESGTWAPAFSSGLFTLTRTAANDSAHVFVAPVPGALVKDRALRGFKPETLEMAYSIDAADSGDDITVELLRYALPANGSAPAAVTVLGGDEDDDYDTSHNTAAKRVLDTGAPQNHTLVVTLDTQEFLTSGQGLAARITVTEADDATGALAVIVKHLRVVGSLRMF